MNKMSTERRAAVLTALVEGNSIASACRMFGVNKVTVLRLLADAGTFAVELHDRYVRDLQTKQVQCDEIWAFCHSKEKNVPIEKRGQFGFGDVWTWTALDADTKLMISWHVGNRDIFDAKIFMHDVAERVASRIQLTTDGLRSYPDAVYSAFRNDIDYAMLVKIYGPDKSGAGRYSPPVVTGIKTEVHCGTPAPEGINTSYVERSNLTIRMTNRRFTRLTNGFSKKLENHKHMQAIQFFHYNFIRRHQTIKTTPAVAATIADKPWTMVEFVEAMVLKELVTGGRLTDYRSAKN